MRRMQRDEEARADAMRGEAEAFGAGDYDLIAEYEDMGQAKKAMDALELAGIDAAEYALVGETVAKAESRIDKRSVHEADAALSNELLWNSVLWGGAGVVAGVVVALISVAIPGWPLNIWYSLMLWILALGTLGGIAGGMSALESGPQAETPYMRVDPGDHVLLGVRSADPKHVQRAETVLQRGNALAVQRYNQQRRQPQT